MSDPAKLPDGIKPGDPVTAKRLGWDERLTPEQEIDRESYAEMGYASDDLSGPLDVIDVPADDYAPAMTLCLVGGQEADPKTVRPLSSRP